MIPNRWIMLFENWQGLLRVVVVGTLAYAALVLLLRVSGKRTLSKMNAFDLIVTVALGSTLATVLLSKDVALAEGVLAFALLIGLQYAITWCSARSRGFETWVKARPTLLVYNGAFIPGVLRDQRVTEAEVQAVVREQGIGSLGEVDAVVLETDGSLTVIKKAGDRRSGSLANVRLPGEGEDRHGDG
jgi:uncharacterized membrane protein YcaP (DUF421 family)